MNYFNIKSLFLIAAIFVGFSPALVVAADEAQEEKKPAIVHVSHEEAQKKLEENKKKVEEKKEAQEEKKPEEKKEEKKSDENKDSDKEKVQNLDDTKVKTSWGVSLAGILGITYCSGICKAHPKAAWFLLGVGAGVGAYAAYQALQEEEVSF